MGKRRHLFSRPLPDTAARWVRAGRADEIFNPADCFVWLNDGLESRYEKGGSEK